MDLAIVNCMSSSFKKGILITSSIDGFLTDREGWLLFQLAKRCRNGVIVEIGSWQGRSTVWLGLGTQASRRLKVYAIDPHVGSEESRRGGRRVETFEKFKKNIDRAGLIDTIVPIVEMAENARKDFNRPISLLFIDGAHDYESVKKDYELWAPLVVEGGHIVFHDTQWEGVKKVCDEAFQRGNFKKIYFQDSICYGIKVKKRSFLDEFRSRRMIELKNVFSDVCTKDMPRSQRKFMKNFVKFQRGLLTLF
jgi:MMP 1-O-methyltransferase